MLLLQQLFRLLNNRKGFSMAKLKAIHAIWNKKNPVAPGDSFECNDQRDIDRLLSSGAAVIDESTAVVNERERISGILLFQRIAEVTNLGHLISDALNNPAMTKESVAVQILTVLDAQLKVDAPANNNQMNDSISSNESSESDASGLTIPDDAAMAGQIVPNDMFDKPNTVDTSLSEISFKIPGIDDDAVAKVLVAAGIDSIEKAKQLTKEQLVAVPGLGYNNAQKVFKALK
jgi:hypothetical protein